ncbi:thermonuclease family protein [Euzebya sp.]|uniref:thermonuclease family protein n=1 Tax=Euzebya sp. TaxID=1971409 RepID=UPI0035157F86
MPRPAPTRLLIPLIAVIALAACTATGEGALEVAEARDGDSFVATDGVEYRVGLVNTPELSECGGHEAADRTAALLADGFSVDAYATDDHGRSVARITTPDGDLGVILAAEGLADDRYLDAHRHEHPGYAAEIDDALARAREARTGLWRTCWDDTGPRPTPDPADRRSIPDGSACHPAYVQCLPVGPDLDCADVGHAVDLTGPDDPYRLDGATTARSDGVGCDTYPPWSADETYPYAR